MVSPVRFQPRHFLPIVDATELHQHVSSIRSVEHPGAFREALGVVNPAGNGRVCALGISFLQLPSWAVVEPSSARERTPNEAPHGGAVPRGHGRGASAVTVGAACLATGQVPDQNGAHVHGSADLGADAGKRVPRARARAGAVEALDVHCLDETRLRCDSHQGDGNHEKQELGALFRYDGRHLAVCGDRNKPAQR